MYYVLTEHMGEKERRKFDRKHGLVPPPPPIDDPLLPAELQGVTPPDWWDDAGGSVWDGPKAAKS